jgi:hypothetical protein
MGVWEYGSMGVWEYGSMGVKNFQLFRPPTANGQRPTVICHDPLCDPPVNLVFRDNPFVLSFTF